MNKRFKRILRLILAVATLMSVMVMATHAEEATPAEPEEGMWEVALENGYFTYDVTGVSGSSHMQGICVDDKMEYMYLSYTDTLAKVSLKTGEVVGTVSGFGTGSYLAEGGAHIGCLAYYDGRIYGSLEYKSPGKKWFIIAFDEDAITEVGQDFMDMETGVDGILLADPTADFRNVLNDGDKIDSPDGFAQNEENLGHAYGCSGIDGITFGTMPGDDSGKIYCFVAYGIYKWTDRYDNNYNILKVYDPEDLDERYDATTGTGDLAVRRFVYERGVNPVYEEDELLASLDTLYAWTGATNYGVQNLEFNKDTGDLEMYTYGTTKKWENWTRQGLFIIDSTVAPVEREIEVGQSNTNPDEAAKAAAIAKAESYKVDGKYPTGKHVAIKCICGGNCEAQTWGDTGFTSVLCGTKVPVIATYGTISLGNNYYYLADGNHSVSLYHRDENYNFTKITSQADIALENGYLHYDVTGVSGSSHMQGICVDDKMEYMYLSYTDTLAKVSLKTGEVVGTVSGFGTGSYLAEGGAHIGCLAYHDGRIYGSLEYKSPGKKWFIIAFDEDAITEVGQDFMDMETGVDGILLADPTADFRNVLNDGDKIDSPDGFAQNEENLGHAYGCSGIDGITFGTMPGDDSGKIYCFVAYGIYKWTDRYDNNYNILKVYDPEDLDDRYDETTGTGDLAVRRFVYERGINPVYEEDELLASLDTLYAWTGATNYGVQNLEFNKDTGDLEMYTYGTTKKWENWQRKGLFIIDSTVAPVEREIEVGQSNTNPDEAAKAAAIAKAECYKVDGKYPTGKHVAIKCICGNDCQAETWGDTGFTSVLCGTKVPVIATYGTISLGKNYYFLADGNHSVSLYHRDENYNFTRVTTYEDVTEGHWALNAIEAVTAAGLFNGTSETTFSPDADTTRGQLMTVLARLSGADTTGNAIEKGVAWAVANGVSDGTNPDGKISREQLVTMLYRFAGSPAVTGDLSTYTDAGSVSDWAKDAMLWAVTNGIIKGMTETTLVPGANATRAQVATIMQRYTALQKAA